MKAKIKSIIVKIPFIKEYLSQRRDSNYKKLLKSEIPVFVYQMGKVASSSIYTSLNRQYKGACIHAHSFSVSHENAAVRDLYEAFKHENLQIKVISLVREPISRNISAFFENFERDTGFKYQDNPYSIEELLNVFIENYKHDIPLTWFDRNIKLNFGIDVYDVPFPDEGFITTKNKNIDFLLMRHDLKDNQKEKIISSFVGVKNFRLGNVNIGGKKGYSSTYNKFKTLSIPEDYIDSMLDSKYVKHFFSNNIEIIKNKWKSH